MQNFWIRHHLGQIDHPRVPLRAADPGLVAVHNRQVSGGLRVNPGQNDDRARALRPRVVVRSERADQLAVLQGTVETYDRVAAGEQVVLDTFQGYYRGYNNHS